MKFLTVASIEFGTYQPSLSIGLPTSLDERERRSRVYRNDSQIHEPKYPYLNVRLASRSAHLDEGKRRIPRKGCCAALHNGIVNFENYQGLLSVSKRNHVAVE